MEQEIDIYFITNGSAIFAVPTMYYNKTEGFRNVSGERRLIAIARNVLRRD